MGQPMLYGQVVKVGIALRGLEVATTARMRRYWLNTLEQWEAHAQAAGFRSLDAWLAASK